MHFVGDSLRDARRCAAIIETATPVPEAWKIERPLMITWRAHSLGDANHANRIPVLTGPRFGDEINQPRRCYQRLQRASAASAAQRFFRNVGEGWRSLGR